jgi:hypothetical protein
MAKKAVAPSFGEKLGLMYKRWTLDCVVTIAHAVALDFSRRLELYQQVADDIAAKLTELQANYGFQADFPDMPIRLRLMQPVFGGSDGQGSGNDGSAFQTYRFPGLLAANDFNLNAQPTAFPGLREAVRSALVPFKTHMDDLDGASLRQTERRMTSILDIAQSVLKDSSVFAVFGINASINPAWPLESTDPHGAQMIENITTQLPDLPYGVISREMFVHIQRIAEKGFQSIRIIEDNNIEDPAFDIDPLITELFAWGFELKLVGSARLQPQAPQMVPPVTAATGSSAARVGSQPPALSRPTTVASVRPANMYRR